MELKEGGYYCDRKDRVWGPLKRWQNGWFTDGKEFWNRQGRRNVYTITDIDLVEEMEMVSPLITKTMVVSYVVADGRSFRSINEAAQDLIAWRYMGENKPPMSQWIVDNREWLSVLFKEVDNAE